MFLRSAICAALLLVATTATALRVGGSKDIILTPNVTTGIDVGLIWVEGAGLSAGQYAPIAQRTQEAAAKRGLRLWVGIPQCSLNVCEPLVVGNDVKRTFSEMTADGFPAAAPIFAAAHSAGGVFLDMLIANPPKGYPVKFSGVALMGSFVLRTMNQTWQHPTLQIAGELDGLCRITRMAQSWELQLGQRGGLAVKSAWQNFPVGVIAGGSHMRFASGVPPLLVKERDLMPTVSEATVHKEVGQHIANWLVIQLNLNGTFNVPSSAVSSAESQLQAWLTTSYSTYMEPILDSFEEEGLYHLKPPCNCENSCNPADIPPGYIPCGSDPFGKVNLNYCFPDQRGSWCRVGSKWGPKVQEAIGTCYANEAASECSTEGFTVNVTAAFHPVSQTKPHSNLPWIFNNCTSPTSDCHLKANMVAMNSYFNDPLDTGFFQQTATNIALKMKSRQWYRMQAGYKNVSYVGSDGNNLGLCQQANKMALAYAKQKATAGQLARYESIGQKIVWGDDHATWGGPDFIDAKLGKKYDNKASTVTISSPSLVTDYNFIISSSRAMHYCKVLSPAMALEWILIDGLRLHGSLANATKTE